MGWSAKPPERSAATAIAAGVAAAIASLAAAIASLAVAALATALIATTVGATEATAVIAAAAAATEAPADSAQIVPAHPDSAAPPPTFRPAEWETLSTGLPEEARLAPIVGFRYNRVDGPAPTLGAAVRSERARNPLLHAKATYAVSRERFLYEAGFEAPLGDPAHFRIGGTAYRRTATEDAWIVGETENTFFALFARTDYRDHYEAQGLEGHAAWEPGRDFEFRATLIVEDQGSLSTEARFSLFGAEDQFRDNPPIEEGDDGVLALAVRIGPASLPSEGGANAGLTYERAGSPVDGDFEYGRLRGSARTRLRLSPRQEARARVIAGSTVEGVLPSQKIWHTGGIGTLRGHDYKKFSGDQFLLASAEYYLLARKNIWAFTFFDWGSAWFGRDNLPRQQFALDGGLGIRLGEGPIAVTAARNLQASEAPILIGVRLGGSF